MSREIYWSYPAYEPPHGKFIKLQCSVLGTNVTWRCYGIYIDKSIVAFLPTKRISYRIEAWREALPHELEHAEKCKETFTKWSDKRGQEYRAWMIETFYNKPVATVG